ncbi:MAG: tetratricopeptide repeat protein [Bacteroidales bacterium]
MKIKTNWVLLLICSCSVLLFSCNNPDNTSSNSKVQSTDILENKEQSGSEANCQMYETALMTDSLNTDIRLKLAAEYYMNKDLQKAQFHYLKIIGYDKNNMAALFNLGNISYDLQQYSQAIKYYEAFLEKDSNNSNVRCDLATCYLNIDNPQKAISILQENIRLNANHLQSHYNLSVVLKQVGKTEEAEKELKIYNALSANQNTVNQ